MPDVEFEERPDGVGLITLNRPDSLNAMGGTLLEDLGDALEACEADRRIRCVALTGAGRGFCAGGDVKGMASGGGGAGDGRSSVPSALDASVRGLRRHQNRTSLKLHTMPKPTVALVNGAAAGAGMVLALSCDIRIVSDKAKFVTAYRNVAFSGDFGGAYFLQQIVGRGRGLELYLTSEHIDAARALELGIANRVVPHDELMAQGLEFCGELAAGPTGTFAKMKSNFNLAAVAGLQDVLDTEALNHILTGMSHDHREGAAAFVEKRKPSFEGV